jgi:hypothetical protein
LRLQGKGKAGIEFVTSAERDQIGFTKPVHVMLNARNLRGRMKDFQPLLTGTTYFSTLGAKLLERDEANQPSA